MVFGLSIAVTAVPSVYQCADTHRMALGFGIELPSRRQDSVYGLRSRVFMGLPWPKNTTGILDLLRCIGMPLRELEQQDLGALPLFEHDLGGIGRHYRAHLLDTLAGGLLAVTRHVQKSPSGAL